MTQLYILQFNLSTQNYILAQDLVSLKDRLSSLKISTMYDLTCWLIFSKSQKNF
jgi:hypothetical protein